MLSSSISILWLAASISVDATSYVYGNIEVAVFFGGVDLPQNGTTWMKAVMHDIHVPDDKTYKTTLGYLGTKGMDQCVTVPYTMTQDYWGDITTFYSTINDDLIGGNTDPMDTMEAIAWLASVGAGFSKPTEGDNTTRYLIIQTNSDTAWSEDSSQPPIDYEKNGIDCSNADQLPTLEQVAQILEENQIYLYIQTTSGNGVYWKSVVNTLLNRPLPLGQAQLWSDEGNWADVQHWMERVEWWLYEETTTTTTVTPTTPTTVTPTTTPTTTTVTTESTSMSGAQTDTTPPISVPLNGNLEVAMFFGGTPAMNTNGTLWMKDVLGAFKVPAGMYYKQALGFLGTKGVNKCVDVAFQLTDDQTQIDEFYATLEENLPTDNDGSMDTLEAIAWLAYQGAGFSKPKDGDRTTRVLVLQTDGSAAWNPNEGDWIDYSNGVDCSAVSSLPTLSQVRQILEETQVYVYVQTTAEFYPEFWNHMMYTALGRPEPYSHVQHWFDEGNWRHIQRYIPEVEAAASVGVITSPAPGQITTPGAAGRTTSPRSPWKDNTTDDHEGSLASITAAGLAAIAAALLVVLLV